MSTTPQVTAALLRTDQIHANPRNVRHSLNLDDEFLTSIAENGVLVPVVVVQLNADTPDAEPVYELKMGHRRHAGARSGEIESIPAHILDPSLREAGQDYIEQLIENDAAFRRALSPLEQADALFGALEEGASIATVARRTGRSKEQVTRAAEAAKMLGAGTRTVLEASDAYDLDLEVLAALGEFDDDPDAVARLIEAHQNGTFPYQLSQQRTERAERMARETRRAELKRDGIRLWEDASNLPPRAQWLEDLVDADGEDLDEADHVRCPGHAVVWDDTGSADPAAVAALCLNPAAYSHYTSGTEPAAQTTPAAARATSDEDSADEDETEEPEADEEDEEAKRAAAKAAERARAEAEAKAAAETEQRRREHHLKLAGNKAYRAAIDARRAFLRQLITRKSAPKPLAAWVTQTLLSCPKPVQSWTGDTSRSAILADLLALSAEEGKAASAEDRATWIGSSATPTRLLFVNFAIIAASYEKRIERASTWRQDQPEWDSEEIRADARVYLKFLAELGHQLSPVERNVIDDTPFEIEEEPAATPLDHADGVEADQSADTQD
ncbi:ParB N-terminal domain-containing protein [Streptomyces sp. NPDC005799]|uniref:ParB/RepB/Spo0J family partition protein n=1 Tax=Streptomyces sp. NPDC005799 TaxID=3154678 RepID=UPI0034024E12